MLTRMAKESGRRDADDRRFGLTGFPQAEGQEAFERGLDEPDRSRREDRPDEGRLEPHLACRSMRLIWTPAWRWQAPIHSVEAGDTGTLGPTLEEAQKNLAAVGLTPTW